MGDSSTR
jgi:hypothetical protein